MNLIIKRHGSYITTTSVKRISFSNKFATIMRDAIHTLPTHKIIGVFI
jgi:hypothetical protein